MFDLEPIAKKIQQRMFEKMKALGDHKIFPGKAQSNIDNLTFDKMASRSTFIKMVSNQSIPVTIGGGLLKDNGQMYGGFDVYSPRTYSKRTGEVYTGTLEQNQKLFKSNPEFKGMSKEVRKGAFGITHGTTHTTVNSNSRPIPGIQSIDVTFKGGSKAMREATVTWTCFSWEELDELMPHFLAHGKTVLLEWGWVYDGFSIFDMPSFVDTNGRITADAFTDVKDVVIEGRGDFDMMIGKVKNFEFSTTSDGSFACQTILSSVGVNMFNNPQPNAAVKDPGTTFDININEDSEEVVTKLEQATAGENTGNVGDVLTLNTSATLKLFIANIDDYISKEIPTTVDYRTSTTGARLNQGTELLYWNPGSWITHYKTVGNDTGTHPEIIDSWVRWGWFEDNVLSKFLNMTNANGETIIKFKSVEKILSSGGESSGVYESVKIKNHKYLETTDINNHILPGQFYPAQPRPLDIPEQTDTETGNTVAAQTITLPGDSELLKKLAEIVNDKEKFDRFTTSSVTRIRKVLNEAGMKKFQTDIYGEDVVAILNNETVTPYDGIKTDPLGGAGDDGQGNLHIEGQRISQAGEGTVLRASDEVLTTEGYVSTDYEAHFTDDDYDEIEEVVSDSRFGALRNMLINTKIIKKAFGVGSDFNVESINIFEALETMFDMINQDLNFWDYEVSVDSDDTSLAKIVDKNVTALDFDDIDVTEGMPSKRTKVDSNNIIIGKEGIFYFPTWQTNSFVINQNVNAKVPNALQLTAMYGSNLDATSELTNPGNDATEKEAVLAGGLYNDFLDVRNKGLNIAFKNEIKNITTTMDVPTKKSHMDGTVLRYIIDNAAKLEEKYEDRLDVVEANIKSAAITKYNEAIKVDASLPIPPPRTLTDVEIGEILRFEQTSELYKKNFLGSSSANKSVTDLIGTKFTDKNKLKPEYLNSVGYLTTEHGINAEDKKPLTMHLDLELEIDGTGGIYPGNSFHSSYLPSKYQKLVVYQAFDISHKVDSTGWTTSITGPMRSTGNLVLTPKPTDEKIKEAILNFKKKSEQDHLDAVKKLEVKSNENFKKAAAARPAGVPTGFCWVAAELYGGWYEPRTILARKFVNSSKFPKILFNLYMKYGERTARFIKKYKFMKLIFKPIFDLFVRMGKRL